MELGVALLVVIAVGAAAQALTGMGFSLLCVPPFVVALGPAKGVVVVNALAVAVSVVNLVRERHHVELRHLRWLLPSALAAIPVATWLVRRVDARLLSVVCGLAVLAAVAALAAGFRAARVRGPRGAIAAGVASGLMNVIGGVGGPAVAGYAINAEWPPERIRGVFAAYFLVLNTVAVFAVGVPELSATAWGLATVALLVGLAAGMYIAGRCDKEVVRRAILVVAGCGACVVVAHGLFGG
jgi:uncharacterized membrane protein YfcA